MNFSEMKQEFSIFHRSITRREKLTLYFFMGAALSLFIAVWIMFPIQHALSSEGKGLKVFLTINSNQGGQAAAIDTYQDGTKIDGKLGQINNEVSEMTLNYQKGQVDNGEFQICVGLSDGVQGCGAGYNGEAKEPVYVTVNLYRDVQPQPSQQGNDQSQSSSNSNNNESNNNNALSQSQETKREDVEKEQISTIDLGVMHVATVVLARANVATHLTTL